LTKVYLIRHAESEGNIYRRAHGHYNGLLTGRASAQLEMLKSRFDGEHIDAVYSSDLSRASDTAKAISEPRDLPIITSQALREAGLGVWEDTAWGDIEYLSPEMNRNFGHDPAEWSVSGSENYEDVKSRMLSFILETAKRHDGETIALFSHGFAIRSFLCHVNGIASHETDKIPYCDNTAVALLLFNNNELKLEYYNDNSHLNTEISTLANQSWWRTEQKWQSGNLRFMPLNEVAGESLIRIFKAKAGERAHVDMQYAAFQGDEPIGILGLDTERERRLSAGWISYLHIVPAYRNKGFGVQLLGLAVSDFRKKRRSRLRMEIPSGSLGINFMSKLGFHTLDVTDAQCLMEKDIRNW